MQRRHFEAIAQAIRETRVTVCQSSGRFRNQEEVKAALLALDIVSVELLGAAKRFNPQCDKERFLSACAHSEYGGGYNDKSTRRNSPA